MISFSDGSRGDKKKVLVGSMKYLIDVGSRLLQPTVSCQHLLNVLYTYKNPIKIEQ